MAEERDRAKSRYSNPPKVAKKGMQDKEESGAESKAKSSAGSPPDMDDVRSVGKVGEDPGPEGGRDAEWGVVASRHKQEHSGMLKRHGEEHSSMVERHHKEAKEMHGRHSKELQDHFEGGAEGEAEGSAGSPPMLGKTESEGKKGSEP